MIAPHILVLTAWFSIAWGIYLLFTIHDFRRRADRVVSLRQVVVAFCLWSICFSLFFRTGMVLLGFGEVTAGQVTFFTLIGTNVMGSLFVLASLRRD